MIPKAWWKTAAVLVAAGLAAGCQTKQPVEPTTPDQVRAGAPIFFHPAVPRANDGAWPQPFGAPATGAFAPAPEGAVTHWAGFQRRWAVGLRLERLPAVQ